MPINSLQFSKSHAVRSVAGLAATATLAGTFSASCSTTPDAVGAERPRAVMPPVISQDRGRAEYVQIAGRPELSTHDLEDWFMVFVPTGIRSNGGEWAVVDILVGQPSPSEPQSSSDGVDLFWIWHNYLESYSSRGRCVKIKRQAGQDVATINWALAGPARAEVAQRTLDTGGYVEHHFLGRGSHEKEYIWAVVAVPVHLAEPISPGETLRLRLSEDVCRKYYNGCEIEQECRVELLRRE